MELLIERCAGLDVHKASVTATVRVPDPSGGRLQQTRSFRATTGEHAAVAALTPVELRGSAFGLLAVVQSFGNLAASAIARLLWTTASPRVAFGYLVAWMLLAQVGLLMTRRSPA